jgi:hypothetical protein
MITVQMLKNITIPITTLVIGIFKKKEKYLHERMIVMFYSCRERPINEGACKYIMYPHIMSHGKRLFKIMRLQLQICITNLILY